MDQRDLRQIFSAFATGVTVVTAYDDEGAPVGITANSFTSVSLEPALVLWCLDNRSRHLSTFSDGTPFSIHILSEGQEDTAMQFARSGASGLVQRGDGASELTPKIDGALARVECRVADLHVAGDHTIIIGEIREAEIVEAAPLVFQKSRFGHFTPASQLSGQEAWHILVDMWS
ncbi:MAG: flavin reductase family protein [Henriciella sp.]|uniref:flavin reductase family protein n=1 Tax=Henriciella sp. TaxID=1968823 RepID=UPI003C7126B8